MPNREQIITVIMIAMYASLVTNSIATVIDMFNSHKEKNMSETIPVIMALTASLITAYILNKKL